MQALKYVRKNCLYVNALVKLIRFWIHATLRSVAVGFSFFILFFYFSLHTISSIAECNSGFQLGQQLAICPWHMACAL